MALRALNPRRRHRRPAAPVPMPAPGNALHGYAREFREWTLAKAYSERTVRTQHGAITRFIVWADDSPLLAGLGGNVNFNRPIIKSCSFRHTRELTKAKLCLVSGMYFDIVVSKQPK